MDVPFYQTHWFNIDLVQLAQQHHFRPNEGIEPKFYEAIYQQLLGRESDVLTQEWANNKSQLSPHIEQLILKYKNKESKILSVGCGFGLVELPLIKKGYQIELQECQNYSLQYIEKIAGAMPVNTILSHDLSELPFQHYDMILAITSTYCLNKATLALFLKRIHELLKPGGIFFWYETAYGWLDLKNKLTALRHGQEGILWGWKRSLRSQVKLAAAHGLIAQETYYLNGKNEVMQPQCRLGLPRIHEHAVWQAGVYQIPS